MGDDGELCGNPLDAAAQVSQARLARAAAAHFLLEFSTEGAEVVGEALRLCWQWPRAGGLSGNFLLRWLHVKLPLLIVIACRARASRTAGVFIFSPRPTKPEGRD